MIATLSQQEIEALIPHRDPMLLLDQVQILSPTVAKGSYYVRGDEFFLQGHYPGNPMVPGNIQSEMLAQLGAVLVNYNTSLEGHPYHNLRNGRTPLLAGLERVRFKRAVKPGQTLDLEVVLTKDAGLVVHGDAAIKVEDKLAASLELIVAYY